MAVTQSMWERLVLHVAKERPLIFAGPQNDTGEVTIQAISCLYWTPMPDGNMFIMLLETLFMSDLPVLQPLLSCEFN